ncbi:MAG: LysR family transcriptional regulator [Deltaproteobacteria bacterium]|nr:LysR family transcriptional regulator [Deltaproteobacteria bacterium]
MEGEEPDIRQLRTFRTVARLLNFNRAAEQLPYVQPGISAQIQSLVCSSFHLLQF